MLDCCSSRQHLDQRNLQNPEITHQLRFMNEAESEVSLPIAQVERAFTLVRQYSINGIITFSQLTKGVLVDLQNGDLSAETGDKLAAFLKLPFFEARGKVPSLTPDITLSNRPLDAFLVMLFLLLYVTPDSSQSMRALKQRVAALIGMIYGEELQVMERHSPQFVRLLEKLFFIPTILCAQTVMCEFGLEQEVTGQRAYFRMQDKIGKGVLLKGEVTPDDVDDLQRLYRMMTRNNILKDFVLFVLKQHFSASRALISRKAFQQRIFDFDFFMVRPRQIRYEFLQYIDNHKERVIDHIPRHPLVEHRGSAPDQKMKKKRQFKQKPKIQIDRLSSAGSIRSVSKQKKVRRQEPLPSLPPLPIRQHSSDNIRGPSAPIPDRQYQNPFEQVKGPRTESKPKRSLAILDLDSLQRKGSYQRQGSDQKGSFLQRAIDGGSGPHRMGSSVSQKSQEDSNILDLVGTPKQKVAPILEQPQEQSKVVKKDILGEQVTLDYPAAADSPPPKPKQTDKKKRQLLIKEHLAGKFSKSLIKFFLKFQKERSTEQYVHNRKKVDNCKSVDQLIHFTPTMLEQKEKNSLYRLKKSIIDSLTLQDLQSLGKGQGPLNNGIYDFYAKVLHQFESIDSERFVFSHQLGDTETSEPLSLVFLPYQFARKFSEDEEKCVTDFAEEIKTVLRSDFTLIPIEPNALVILDVSVNEATCYSFSAEGANCKFCMIFRDVHIFYYFVLAVSLGCCQWQRRPRGAVEWDF